MRAPAARVRPARREDLRALSLVLARAFRDDPVHRWILPTELDWALSSDRFFAMLLRDALRADGVFTTEAQEGAAVWFFPNHDPGSRWERLANLLRWSLALGGRTGRVAGALARLEAQHPPEPHHYLALLGRDPRHRGRGLGSALLAPVLARCDAERVPAYLESSKPENVPFYAGHGFAVQGETRLDEGPTVIRMLRRPVAP